MRVSGTGITTFTAKVRNGFRINTSLALEWFKAADGNYRATDRGAASDVYEAEIALRGLRGDLETFVTQINANREADVNTVTLDMFNENEKIFGADVDHTSITATLLDTPKIQQAALKVFELSANFRAISPSFTGSASFPALRYLSRGFDANVNKYTINKLDSYVGAYTYLDQSYDTGMFEGTFQFTNSELIGLRRYIATNRSTTVVIADIAGVSNPFGPLRGGYPISVKVLELSDEEMQGIDNWYAKLKFAEVV
jgi:hypothetical protein